MGTVTMPSTQGLGHPGVKRQYYMDPSQVPATGGWVRPPAPPGEKQGTGLNWVTPPPRQANQGRGLLAMLLSGQRGAGGGGGRGGGYTTSGGGSQTGGFGRASSSADRGYSGGGMGGRSSSGVGGRRT